MSHHIVVQKRKVFFFPFSNSFIFIINTYPILKHFTIVLSFVIFFILSIVVTNLSTTFDPFSVTLFTHHFRSRHSKTFDTINLTFNEAPILSLKTSQCQFVFYPFYLSYHGLEQIITKKVSCWEALSLLLHKTKHEDADNHLSLLNQF